MQGNSFACEVAIRVRVFSIPKFRTVGRPSLIAQTYGAVSSISFLPLRNSCLCDEPWRSRARTILLKLFFDADRIFSRKVLSLLTCFLKCALCLSRERLCLAEGFGQAIVSVER